MTDQQLSNWIKQHLGPIINDCLIKTETADIYSEDLLGAMAQRETGIKMFKYLGKDPAMNVNALSELMLGDYGQRPGEAEPRYHGYGFWQIDIKSFPEFVNSGDWKDPHKCCIKAINVLLGKRNYLKDRLPGLTGEDFERANVAAYNGGEGGVMRAILNHQDVDKHTFNEDYSAVVWKYRHLYQQAG